MIITLIGGDEKTLYMAEYLEEKGYEVYVSGFEMLEQADKYNIEFEKALNISEYIILPLPTTRDGKTVEAPFSKRTIHLNELVGFKNKTLAAMTEKELGFLDYYDETLKILNAVPSAEGAISQALRLTDITLSGANCLIIGYGRIAKVLSRLLKAFGANLTVTARKPTDIALAKSEGLNCIKTSEYLSAISTADCIFNTVPYPLLVESVLKKCKTSAVIIDLATKAATDFTAAERLGIKAVHAKSMPSKTAPKSAAIIIADHIIEITNGGIKNG